jgi:glucose-6-phosphate 1-dehydrogenase
MNIEKTTIDQTKDPLAVTDPFAMVIFGVTGDLAQHKLMPSLFSLYKQNLLPETFSIIGFSRRDINDQNLRDYFGALQNQAGWADFARHLTIKRSLEEETGYLSCQTTRV